MGNGKSMHLGTIHCKREYNNRIYTMPLVEICGQKRVLVENHLGIVDYTLQQVSIKVYFGFINIQGSSLKITKMCKEKLVISGNIDAVNFQRGD